MNSRSMQPWLQPMQRRISSSAALAHLVDGLGIGDLLARHGDHVGVTQLQDVSGVIGIVDASDRDHRDVDDRFDCSGEAFPDPLGVLHVGHVLVGLVVGRSFDADVVDLAGRGDHLRNLLGIADFESAGAEIVALQVHSDQVVGSYLGAHRVDDAHHDAHPVLQRTAVFVGAVVGERRQE